MPSDHMGLRDKTFVLSKKPRAFQHKVQGVPNMHLYAVSCGVLILLIEGVTFYFFLLIDIYGHKNEVSLLIIHIEVCVHKLNDAGCLKHQVNKIYLKLVLG